jgi:Protein of unknown function (DUF2946)
MQGALGMKWFRSNIRTGARLALLALLAQLALSFGHIHGFAPQAASATQSILPADHAADPQPAPSKQDSDQTTDVCAICAVMAMASTLLFSAPPILLLPDAVRILQGITDAEFAHLKSAGTAFQPRAPPAS